MIDFSTEHNLTSINRYFFLLFFFKFLEHLEDSCFKTTGQQQMRSAIIRTKSFTTTEYCSVAGSVVDNSTVTLADQDQF